MPALELWLGAARDWLICRLPHCWPCCHWCPPKDRAPMSTFGLLVMTE